MGVSFLPSCISGIPYMQEHPVFSILPHIRRSAFLMSASPVHSPLTLWNLQEKSQWRALHATNLSYPCLTLSALTWPSTSKPQFFTRSKNQALEHPTTAMGQKDEYRHADPKVAHKISSKTASFPRLPYSWRLGEEKKKNRPLLSSYKQRYTLNQGSSLRFCSSLILHHLTQQAPTRNLKCQHDESSKSNKFLFHWSYKFRRLLLEQQTLPALYDGWLHRGKAHLIIYSFLHQTSI